MTVVKHVSAAELNRTLARGRARAARLEPKLAAAVEGPLRAAGFEAARRFIEAATPLPGQESSPAPAPAPAITAAAPTPASAMIAVYPLPDEAAALAQSDGEPASILHCTLAFLGEIDDETLSRVVTLMAEVAAEHVPRVGAVGGIGTFGVERDFDAEVLYPSIALPNTPGLAELRHAVVRKLDDAGIEFSRQNDFNPHITLAYTPEPALPSADVLGLPLTFNFLTVARGDVPVNLSLAGPLPPAVAAGGMGGPGLFAAAPSRRMTRAELDRVRALYEAGDLLEAQRLILAVARDSGHTARPACRPGEDRYTCPFGDPSCPCPDGLACHYMPAGDSPAWRAGTALSLAAAGDETPTPKFVKPTPGEVLDVDALVAAIRARTDPVRNAVAETLMSETLAGVGVAFDTTNPLVAKVLAGAGKQIVGIAQTTQRNVARVIDASYNAGLSIPHTADVIRAAMTEASSTRATLIARTELAGVVNGGSVAATQIVSDVTGDVYLKRWMVGGGAKFPRHELDFDLDGQTVGMDEYFEVGGDSLEYPGDPSGSPEEVCNCRCALEYIEAAEAADEGDVIEGETAEDALTAAGAAAAAALPSTAPKAPTKGGTMRGQLARNRRTAKRAQARAAQGASSALSPTEPSPSPPPTRRRREAVLAALTAAGDPAVVQTSFELTQGSLAEREFYNAVVEAEFSETRRASWPCDAELGDHGEVLFRDGGEGVYRLADGTLVHASIGHGWLYMRAASDSRPNVAGVVAEFSSAYPPLYREDTEGLVPITFWTYGRFGPQSRLRMIEAASWKLIEPNYSDVVAGELARLMRADDAGPAFEPGKDGQLLLWQGPPGTGKTWALRALASEWNDWAEFHYITDPDAFFGAHPDYMVDVLLHESYDELEPATAVGEDSTVVSTAPADGKWRILILEDTGELLSATAKAAHGQGLSRLLNVVDGMVGQGLRVLALVTTNDELGELHPAVIRPGRCASQIVFDALSAEEASEWLGSPVAAPATLAELYARSSHTSAAAFAPYEGECADCGHDAEMHFGDDNAGACADDTCSCEEFSEEGDEEEPEEASAGGVVGSARIELLPALKVLAPIELEPLLVLETGVPVVTPPPAPPRTGSVLAWEATFAPEGRRTEDGRVFAPGALSWRELPLSLMAMLETQEGHDGAQVSGRIDEIWRDEAAGLIRASGEFDSGDFGVEVARLVDERTLRGLSVDIAIRAYEIGYESAYLDENGVWKGLPDEDVEGPDMLDLIFGDEPEEPILFVITDGVIGAATVCSFPAFAEAEISLTAAAGMARVRLNGGFTVLEHRGRRIELGPAAVDLEALAARPPESGLAPVLTAAAAGLAPLCPPVDWFDDPELGELTPLTVTDEGRVYGHVAPWGTCHIGIPDVCTTAPRSATGYSMFHLGQIVCEDGSTFDCGKITLGTGHADRTLGWHAAAEHYDHTGTVVADVVSGEDEFGIWFSGALRPDVSEERVRELRAAVLSGDWRNVNGNLEMVAVLAVNVPGFPVPRPRAVVAGGVVQALTAAGLSPESLSRSHVIGRSHEARLAALAARATGGLEGLAARARGEG